MNGDGKEKIWSYCATLESWRMLVYLDSTRLWNRMGALKVFCMQSSCLKFENSELMFIIT